jgi:malonyl-CoA O-methyltransferase
MKTADHSRTVAHRFSRKARPYSEHAAVQRSLAEQLAERLPSEPPPGPVLEVGCGSGELTRHLLRRWDDVDIDAIDLAPGMIHEASERIGQNRGVQWIVADAMTYHGARPYHLMTSNCALHWLHPFRTGMANLLNQLAQDGLVAATLMLDGTLGELHEARIRAAPRKPPAGRLPTFEEVIDVLREHGLLISYASEENRQVALPDAEAVLRMVHDHGLTGGHVSRSHTALGRAELAELSRDYNFNYRNPDGTVRVTYHVGVFVARKSTSYA